MAAARICLILLGLFSFSFPLFADEAADFKQGVALYDAGKFSVAAKVFKQLTATQPRNDAYVYWLGKCYGRRAEKASWFTALKYARMTRDALERAVALNPNNLDAVLDLATYYSDAPGFLGGDSDKATKLRAHAATLATTSAN